jgi:drug/metabolite transporter (DMT)-like permease
MGSVRRAYLALAAGVFCIGWSAIFVQLAHVPGLTSAFYRCFVAWVALACWWVAKPPTRPIPRSRLLLTIVGGVFFGLDLGLWNVAILATSATTATLLANNAPIWVGLITVFIFREHLPAAFWVGISMALAGTALIVGPDALTSTSLGRGHLMALVAGVFYALYLLTTQRVRETADTRGFMTVSVAVCTALLLAACLATGAPLIGFPARSWMALLGLALVSHLGGWLAINYALGHMRAPVVSVGLLGQAVVTAVLSMLVLHDHLTSRQAVGGTLVLAGIYLVNRKRR